MTDITYSAVEAAAKSQFGIDAARLGIDATRLGQAWDDAKPAVKAAYRESVLGAVTGAAPVIEAQVRAQVAAEFTANLDLAYAWERGFTAGFEECLSGGQIDATDDNPYLYQIEATS